MRRWTPDRCGSLARRLASLGVGAWVAAAAAHAADAPWPVAGQQGLVRYVVVPAAAVRDRDAYRREIERLCGPQPTCFVNFYANPAGVAVELPLPAVIESEATAVYRRSGKQQAERLMWSCRLRMGNEPCF